MTLSEFKAWLDGFCENLPAGGAPTAEQFAKIVARLETVRSDIFVVPPAIPPSLPTTPWFGPHPITFGPLTSDPLPDHGQVICGIDWSAEHLADLRMQGRLEGVA